MDQKKVKEIYIDLIFSFNEATNMTAYYLSFIVSIYNDTGRHSYIVVLKIYINSGELIIVY